jgi:hypothetical protein
MRSWLLLVGLAGAALAPGRALAQFDTARPDPVYPLPLGHDHLENGGLYVFGEFIMYRQTNPLQHQAIANRGFIDSDGSITGRQGTFIGSGTLALDAKDAGGPGTFQPGTRFGFGWRFENGSAIEINWSHLFNSHTFAQATLVAPNQQFRQDLADTFLTAPVFNFTNDYAGPAFKAGFGRLADAHAFAVYGIWNGASIMTIDFLQRFDEVQATFRVPVSECETYRCYGIVGPRMDWLWERFRWRTTSINFDGQASPFDVGIYTNIVSNVMYGGHAGLGNEVYLGWGFSLGAEVEAAMFIDVVKERAKYELGQKDFVGQVKRSITDYAAVPELQGRLELAWHPIEGIECKLTYEGSVYFNTVASPHPVSFNVGGLDPAFQRQVRVFDGLQIGIGFIF